MNNIIRLADHCPTAALMAEARDLPHLPPSDTTQADRWMAQPRLSVPLPEPETEICRESDPKAMLVFMFFGVVAAWTGIGIGAFVTSLF